MAHVNERETFLGRVASSAVSHLHSWPSKPGGGMTVCRSLGGPPLARRSGACLA
jgi:hypothetical protein